MIPVESSNIEAVGMETGKLRVRFKTGALYEYDDVPGEVFKEFVNAESKGKFFSQHIRKGYSYRRVEDD